MINAATTAYSGVAQDVQPDKRLGTVNDSAAAIFESIESMRRQRDELNWNINQAESRLQGLSSDLLSPKAAAGLR